MTAFADLFTNILPFTIVCACIVHIVCEITRLKDDERRYQELKALIAKNHSTIYYNVQQIRLMLEGKRPMNAWPDDKEMSEWFERMERMYKEANNEPEADNAK